MAIFSKKASLAIEAVMDVAYNARPDPVQARDIAERLGLPSRYLEQVLQQLVRGKILNGVRGPKGGYVLGRERRKLTLADVLSIIAKMEIEDDYNLGVAELGEKVIAPLIAQTEQEFMEHLSKITFEDLCQKANSLGIEPNEKNPTDFTI